MAHQFFNPRTKDVLNIRRTETHVLRQFGLSRIDCDSDGNYFVRNDNIIKPALFITLVTVGECARLVYSYSNSHLNLSEKILITGFNVYSIVLTIQVILAVVSVARQNTSDILACYENLQEIDQLLFMSNFYAHKKDERECHRAFFGVIALRLSTKVMQSILWNLTIGFNYMNAIWLYTFLALLVDLHTMDYFTWLVVLRSRLVRLQQTTSEYATGEAGALLDRWYERGARGEPGRLRHAVDNFALCYYLLNDQICRLNRHYGFQKNESPVKLMALLFDIINLLQSMAMLYLGVRYIMSFRKYTARMVITAEKGAADRSADEAQRARWAKLVSLCRRRPAVFTAGTFFKLDYSLLASMLGAMVTYSITLSQVNRSAPENATETSLPRRQY